MIQSFDEFLAFLHRFHEPWGAHLPAKDVPDDLPRPLKRLYSEFGSLIHMDPVEHRCPFATQDGLVSTQYLKRIGDTYEFAWENQGNWSCRTPIGRDDPPVYSDARDVWEGPPKGFQLICESLEHFLITLCLQEAVMGCPNLIACDGRDLAAIVASTRKPLWLNGIYVNGEPSHNFYTCEGSGMLILDFGPVWIGSHTDDIEDSLTPTAEFSRIASPI